MKPYSFNSDVLKTHIGSITGSLRFFVFALCFFGLNLSLSSQVTILENFDTGLGTFTGTYSFSTTSPCLVGSARQNLWSSSSTGNLTTPNQLGASNGTDLTISFDYKIIDFSGGGATGLGWGSAVLQYSVDAGVTWVPIFTIDDSSHTASTDCVTITETVLAADLPVGSDVQIQIANTWLAGDYYFTIDNYTATQVVACSAPSALTSSNETNSGADLTWTENGTATLWNLEVGIGGFAPTGTPTDVGVSNPFSFTGGAELTTYDYYVQADCGVDGTSVWIGPASFTTLANCPAPSTLTATNITDSGADLGWTENGAATVYDIEIGTAGFVPTGTPTNATVANPFTYSSGIENTEYEFYVRADCMSTGGVGQSNWVGPFSFTTNCSPIIPDYLEDFATFVPDCWDEASSGDLTTGPMDLGFSSWGTGSFGNSGSPATKINMYSTILDDWVLTPEFDISTGGPFQADFTVALTGWNNTNQGTFGSDDVVHFAITTDGGATWTSLQSWTVANSPAAAGESVVVDLSAYTGVVQFGFYADDGVVDDTEDNDFHLDDFMVRTPPSCVDPSGLSAANTTSSSTELSWVENDVAVAWDLYYGVSPLAAPDGTTVPTEDNVGSNTNYLVSGLTADMTYEFYVRSECGQNGQSAWVGPISEIIPGPGDACSEAIMVNVELDCATATPNTFDFANAVIVDYASCDAFGDNYGAWYTFTASSASVILKTVSVAGFEAAVFDACGGMELYCSSSTATADRTIAGLIAGNTYFLEIWKDGTSADVVEFCLEEGPNCFDPSNIVADPITTTGADISWTVGSAASTAFSLEYGPAAFTPGTGTIISTGTLGGPIPITGLMPGTLYDVYITEVCDGVNTGTTGPAQFATECAVLTPDYCNDFSTFLPLCWDEATDGDLTTGPTGTLGIGNWSASSGFSNTGTNAATKINIFSTTLDDWLLLPEFDLGAAGHGLFMDFDIALTEWNNSNPTTLGTDDQVHVVISADGGTTWTSLQQWDATTPVSALGQYITLDLAAYSGVVQLAFYATDGAVDDPEDNDFHVDNVCVRVPPSCSDPTDLTVTNITVTGADIGLTDNAMATMWDLEIVPAGSSPTGVPTIEDVMTNPYTWTGGMQLTDYDVYMRSDCGQGQSIWLGPETFTTLASCPAPTALAADVTNSSADLSWTAGGSETLWDIELGAAGFTPTGMPTAAGVTNPYTATGLTGETDYEYYVRADCGAVDGLSVWAGPFAFTTLCDAILPDVCEDFTGLDFSNTPQCWLEAGMVLVTG